MNTTPTDAAGPVIPEHKFTPKVTIGEVTREGSLVKYMLPPQVEAANEITKAEEIAKGNKKSVGRIREILERIVPVMNGAEKNAIKSSLEREIQTALNMDYKTTRTLAEEAYTIVFNAVRGAFPAKS